MSRSISIGNIVIFAEEPPAGFKPPDGKRWFVLLDPADFAAATYVKSLAEQRGVSQDELTLMVDRFVEQAAQVDPNAAAPAHGAVEKKLRALVGDKADFSSFPMSGPMLSAVDSFVGWLAPAAAEPAAPAASAEAKAQPAAAGKPSPTEEARLKALVGDPRYYDDKEFRASVDAEYRKAYPAQPAPAAQLPIAPAAQPSGEGEGGEQ